MRILKMLVGLVATVGLVILLRLAMTADASPLMHLSAGASASTPAPAPLPAPPPPADTAGIVAPPNALHRYVAEAMLALPRAYVDRGEDDDSRVARMTMRANEIAAAVEASDLPAELHHKYAIALVFIAQRETLWARRIRDVGNEDEGLAHGYWQIHEWKNLDPMLATTALDLLRHVPGAWCLPSPRPWEGLPKAAKYLREHPFAK